MASFTVYDLPPTQGTLIHDSLFTKEDTMGFFKIDGTRLLIMLKADDKLTIIVPATQEVYDSITTPITTTTRTVMIEILKIAIQNTVEKVLKKLPSEAPGLRFMRDATLDMLLKAEIYLEQLMQEESQERLQRLAINKIQSAFLDAYVTPHHPFCQRRLLREFQELVV